MAKVGEGDPRWIVSERKDGSNVNNWHWTEKNCLPWAKERINALFTNLVLIDKPNEIKATISTVETIKGEASVNMRKGRMFCIYELEIQFKWTGEYFSQQQQKKADDTTAVEESDKIDGTISFPEVSFENDDDDHEIRFVINKCASNNRNKISDLIRSNAVPKVKKEMQNFLIEFKSLKGDIKEVDEANRKDQLNNPLSSSSSSSSSTTSTTAASPAVKSSAAAAVKDVKTVKLDVKFRARSGDVFGALLDSRRIEAYTQSSVQLEPKEGGTFSLFGGNIKGKFLEIDSNALRLVQQWRTSTWPQDHYSKVIITFEDNSDGCVLHLEQSGVPSAEFQNTQQAWNSNVFERMKRLFGWGFDFPGVMF